MRPVAIVDFHEVNDFFETDGEMRVNAADVGSLLTACIIESFEDGREFIKDLRVETGYVLLAEVSSHLFEDLIAELIRKVCVEVRSSETTALGRREPKDLHEHPVDELVEQIDDQGLVPRS